MTRIEIDALRLRCMASLAAYQAQAMNVMEHSKRGEQPPLHELRAEEQALFEYAGVRREFLDALASVYRTE